jgi:hypothetical protein
MSRLVSQKPPKSNFPDRDELARYLNSPHNILEFRFECQDKVKFCHGLSQDIAEPSAPRCLMSSKPNCEGTSFNQIAIADAPGEGLQIGYQVALFVSGEVERANSGVETGVTLFSTFVGLDHLIQRGETAVVHVGRGSAHFAECGRREGAADCGGMSDAGAPFIFADVQRRRLAVRAKQSGRKILAEVATIVTPETLLAWHRKLIANHRKNSDRM